MAWGHQGANLLLSTAASKSHRASQAGCITRALFRKCRLCVLASFGCSVLSPYHDVAEHGRMTALGAGLSLVIECIVFICQDWSCVVCNICATGIVCVISLIGWMGIYQDCHISLTSAAFLFLLVCRLLVDILLT